MTKAEHDFYLQLITYYIKHRQNAKSDVELKELNDILTGLYNVIYGKMKKLK